MYFPPLKIGIFGDSNANGTGFGIYASEDIERNVFIGEYAADLSNLEEIKFCKRRDMIYRLYQTKIPAEELVISPIKHCGYVPLINDLKT